MTPDRACAGIAGRKPAGPGWLPRCRRARLAALALLVVLGGGAAALPEQDLRVLSLRVDLPRAGRALGQVRLSAGVPTEVLPAGYSFEADGVGVEIGGVSLGTFRPVDPGVRVREREAWLHEVRARRAPDRAPARLLLDRGHGRLDLRTGPVDLSALRDAGPSGLSVVVRMGETVFSATIDAEVTARGWAYFRPEDGPVFPPSPPPPPPAGPTFRVLESGLYSAIHTGETAVARSWTEYAALWSRHRPPMPPGIGAPDVGPPNVDFSTEIVVAVFLGDRTDGATVEIAGVVADGTGVAVTYSEVFPGPTCPAPMYVQTPSPYVFAAVTRVSGAVSFRKQTVVRSCP